MFIDTFLGSAMSGSEQEGIRLELKRHVLSESVSPTFLEMSLSTSGCESIV